MFVITSK